MNAVRAFANTMAGRIFAILVIGVVFSACLALALAELKRSDQMEAMRQDRLADRVTQLVRYLDASPQPKRMEALEGAIRGIQRDHTGAEGLDRDPIMTRRLAERLGPHAQVRAEHTPVDTCLRLPEFPRTTRLPSPPDVNPGKCWLVWLTLKDGTRLKLSADTYPLPFEPTRVLDPVFLFAIAAAALLLAAPIARMAMAPVAGLAKAAAELGSDLNGDPMPETGPHEVREASRAFNAMQRRLQGHVRERTQMLAAITHDLQTPITRMRLRLEKVPDPALRERLLADLAAMQAMVREGLDLARSVDSTEAPVAIDLDSLLESVAEDAADAGYDVAFVGGCRADVRARPQAIRRCLGNLVDNAIKYGGGAEVRAVRAGDKAVVTVRDRGPGLPEEELESMFQPFARLETSRSRETGGVGLGLTIARNLAEREGATLVLRNHPEGGIEAVLTYPATCRNAGAAEPRPDGGGWTVRRPRASRRKAKAPVSA